MLSRAAFKRLPDGRGVAAIVESQRWKAKARRRKIAAEKAAALEALEAGPKEGASSVELGSFTPTTGFIPILPESGGDSGSGLEEASANEMAAAATVEEFDLLGNHSAAHP
eukprot:SAG11_NODE_6619_length_1278_cov_0.979644_1_plen_111_part_00